jgi:hypothetical protein
MKPVANKWQYLLASLYACMAFAFFGAVLLDISYAHALSNSPNFFDLAVIFSQAADLLLLLAVITFLAGLSAIGATWNIPSARNFFIASLFLLAAEFLMPALLGSFLLNLQANSGLNLGTWVRLFGNAMCALLAFAAFFKLHPSSP